MILSVIGIVGVIIVSGYLIWDLTTFKVSEMPLCFGDVQHDKCSKCKYQEECLEEYLWK